MKKISGPIANPIIFPVRGRRPNGYWNGYTATERHAETAYDIIADNTTAREFNQIVMALRAGASCPAIAKDLELYRKHMNFTASVKITARHIQEAISHFKSVGDIPRTDRSMGRQVTARSNSRRNVAVLLS
jgi:hypothetical protein